MTHTKSTAKPPCPPVDREKTDSKPERHAEKNVVAAKRTADKCIACEQVVSKVNTQKKHINDGVSLNRILVSMRHDPCEASASC